MDYNTRTTWQAMLTIGEAVHAWGQGAYGKSLLFSSSQICCEIKTALKSLFKNIGQKI